MQLWKFGELKSLPTLPIYRCAHRDGDGLAGGVSERPNAQNAQFVGPSAHQGSSERGINGRPTEYELGSEAVV